MVDLAIFIVLVIILILLVVLRFLYNRAVEEFVMLVANNYKKSKWRLIFNSDTCILSHFY